MTANAQSDGVKKVAELIKDIRIAMFVTLDASGRPHSRPMATQHTEFDGTLWFMTSAETAKNAEIEKEPRVNVAYMSTSSESYLSVSGDADIVNDRERIAELWNPIMNAWFEGPDDPTLRLIRVRVQEAEYWDTPGGKVASLISIVKAVVTGNQTDMSSDTGTVTF